MPGVLLLLAYHDIPCAVVVTEAFSFRTLRFGTSMSGCGVQRVWLLKE